MCFGTKQVHGPCPSSKHRPEHLTNTGRLKVRRPSVLEPNNHLLTLLVKESIPRCQPYSHGRKSSRECTLRSQRVLRWLRKDCKTWREAMHRGRSSPRWSRRWYEMRHACHNPQCTTDPSRALRGQVQQLCRHSRLPRSSYFLEWKRRAIDDGQYPVSRLRCLPHSVSSPSVQADILLYSIDPATPASASGSSISALSTHLSHIFSRSPPRDPPLAP